ncbi:MAG: diguanylate cyclase domain-containing protein [Athalassotoga sp.]
MIPKFLTLSEAEKRLLDMHAFELSKRVDGFSSEFYEWISKKENFSELVKKYPLDRMKDDVSRIYIQIIFPDDKYEKTVETLIETHAKIGISPDDLIAVYDMCYDHIQNGIESLDIDQKDKIILKSAIRKRIENVMFIHINGFQDLQKKRLEARENFYKALTDIGRIRIEYDEMIELDKILFQIASSIAENIGLALVWIGKADPKDKWIKIVAAAGIASDYARDLKISLNAIIPEGKGPAGISMSSEKPFVTDNADKFNLGGSANTSFKTTDGKIWNISMYNEKGKKFPDRIEDLLIDLSKALKILIENYNRSNELSNIRNYEKGLMEIRKLLITNPPPDMIYNKITKIISEYTGKMDNVKIVVPSSNSEWMITISSSGEDSKFFLNPQNSQTISTDPNRFPEGQIVTSKCFRDGKPAMVNPETDPVYLSYWGKYPDLIRLKSIASWPIFEKGIGNPVAVLTVGSQDPDYFTKDLTMLIEQIVSDVEMAIERYRKDEKLEWLGLHDPITGLPNRMYFEQSARNAIKYASRGHKKIAIGFMDIDHFKRWNDTFGHEFGDELLKKIGTKIGSIIRGGDVIAKMGGDEFLFHVLFDTTEELNTVTQRIKDNLSSVDKRMNLSCSIGWAIYPDDAQDLRDLMNLANKEMYIQRKRKDETL